MSIKNVVNSRLADISTYDGAGKITGLGVGNIVANAITSAGNVTANGLSINGSAVITGNANIQGTLSYNNITNLTTSNLVLGLGNNQSGINVTGGGIVVGNTAEASWLYNQPTSTWNTNLGITANGNITGSYILGNGSQLTGIPAGYTNTDVTNLLLAGNVSSNIITTANISGSYIIGNGSQLTGLPAGYSNANVTTLLASGNVSSNVVTTANINGAILNATTSVYAGVDVITGNIANTNATKTRITSFGANSYIQTGNGTPLTTGNIIFAPYSDANVRVRIDTSSGNLYASGNIFDQNGQIYNVPANYYYAGFATQPANVSTGSTVLFNGKYESSGSGISYNAGSGVFTLQPGTYSLTAALGLTNRVGNGEIDYVWVYAGNTAYIGSTAGTLTTDLNVPAGFQTTAQGVVTVTTPTQVKLYLLFAGANQVLAANQCYGLIEQIGGQAPITNTAQYDSVYYTANATTVASGATADIVSVTLPSAGTWEIIYFLDGETSASGAELRAFLTDSSNTIIQNTGAIVIYSGAGGAYTTATRSVIVTTTGATTYKLRAKAIGAPASVYGNNNGTGGKSDAGGSGLTYKQIGGYSAVSPGLYVTKASGIVNSGVDVTLGNLKVRMPTSGNRSLQVSTITGTYTVYGSCSYVAVGSGGAAYIGGGGAALSVTTTPAYLKSTMNFLNAGDTCTWLIMDTSQAISWRIELIVGFGFNDNMISIERMV